MEIRKRTGGSSTLLLTKTQAALDTTKFYNFLCSFSGSSPTSVKYLIWEFGTTKPSTTPSDQTYSDSSSPVTGSGGVAVVISGGATAGVFNQVTIDNVRVDGTP